MQQQPVPVTQPDNRFWFEKKLNLPHLNPNEIKEQIAAANTLVHSLDGIDKETLKLIGALVTAMIKLQQSGGKDDLQTFCHIIEIISTIPQDKLDKVVSIVGDIRGTTEAVHKIINSLPPELLTGLKISDLAGEIKKEMGK
jgi:hypothetical protein